MSRVLLAFSLLCWVGCADYPEELGRKDGEVSAGPFLTHDAVYFADTAVLHMIAKTSTNLQSARPIDVGIDADGEAIVGEDALYVVSLDGTQLFRVGRDGKKVLVVEDYDGGRYLPIGGAVAGNTYVLRQEYNQTEYSLLKLTNEGSEVVAVIGYTPYLSLTTDGFLANGKDGIIKVTVSDGSVTQVSDKLSPLLPTYGDRFLLQVFDGANRVLFLANTQSKDLVKLTTLGDKLQGLTCITLDAKRAYWSSAHSTSSQAQRLFSCLLDKCEPQIVVDNLYGDCRKLAVDDTHIYWRTEDKLIRQKKPH